jgi:alanyl-tRNA synthetase
VIGLGLKENFWMMGDTGPMGPCSEIHCWGGQGKAPALPTTSSSEAEWDSWLEIWNLVFMQYERREANGPLHPLPAPSIDTGAGLERVSSVLQGVSSNYDTDLFKPLIAAAADIAKIPYGSDPSRDTSMRVIADHARASSFLIADGVFPDKTGREYVLRRIFRRAVRHGKLLGINEPFMHRVCAVVIEEMKGAFPELQERSAIIRELALEEEKRFRATLDRGLGLLEEEFERLDETSDKLVAGAKVFQLYDTYGFPEDLTEIIADERGYKIDRDGYERELESARERSKFSGSSSEAITDDYKALDQEIGKSEFLGYEGDGLTGSGKVVALTVGGQRVGSAASGSNVTVVADQTPFYAESGGQTGDTGTITTSDGGVISIRDTKRPAGNTVVHLGKVESGSVSVGDAITMQVDGERRTRIRANHSATHLLHLALKKVLGDHVAQKGSLVTPERLRFDFAHFSPMSDAQKQEVEDWVNAQIRANVDSLTEVLASDEAKKRGAVAMFGEKYGEKVRVVRIGNESLEFCGGTHVFRTGDIGLCKILGESGIAQGVRRLEAVTGVGALDYLRRLESELGRVGTRLKVSTFEVAERVDKLQSSNKSLEREVTTLKAKLASGGGGRDLMSEVTDIEGVKLLALSTEVDDVKALRDLGDKLREKLGSGIIVLAGVSPDKVSLLAMVTKDLTDRFHAGKLLKSVAEIIGGRGGGRPDMAQGGGKDASKLPEALAVAADLVRDAALA